MFNFDENIGYYDGFMRILAILKFYMSTPKIFPKKKRPIKDKNTAQIRK